jgi:hypothetical protein
MSWPIGKPNPAATPASTARRASAYAALGVDPTDVAAAPRITHLLDELEDGRATALLVLRASDLPEARKFIFQYDNPLLPAAVRRVLPVEAFCVAAGISPTRLWAVIAELYRLQKAQVGAIKAARRHSAIVDVNSEVAATPDGVEDRMAHLKHMGFTPSPRGSVINIGVSASANATAQSASASALAPPEDTIRRMVEARQRAALGSAAPPPQLPAETPSERVPRPFEPRVPVTINADYDEADE